MSWKIDYSHSQVQFTVRHLMISRVRGEFEKFNVEIDLDEKHPERTSVKSQIETASINTRESRRDAHLRSPDFFNSEKYPQMVFESRKVEVLDGNHARMSGDLTIREETHPVTLDVEYMGQVTNLQGLISAGFSGHGVINRKDWGLNWNQTLETGGVLVSDEVEINIELEVIQQPDA